MSSFPEFGTLSDFVETLRHRDHAYMAMIEDLQAEIARPDTRVDAIWTLRRLSEPALNRDRMWRWRWNYAGRQIAKAFSGVAAALAKLRQGQS